MHAARQDSTANATSIDNERFSLFDIFMPVNIPQDQLNSWVSEAERGYDPVVLKSAGAVALAGAQRLLKLSLCVSPPKS